MATQIAGRQIQDGAIDNAKVAGGAAIATSKLADGADFIQRDGSVPFTNDQSHGSQKIINLGTGTVSTDAVNLGQVEALIAALNSFFDNKPSARVASTANVTISNPGTSTFDGVSISSGDRVVLRAQTLPEENGIYVFNGSSSAMTRATDMDVWVEVPGALVAVEQGTTYADYLFLCTSNQSGTIGVTAITWTQANAAGYSNSNFVDKETPSGSVNGSNVTFTLANTPTVGSVHFYLNGLLQDEGDDYTISGVTITMATAPIAGEKVRASYRK